MIAAVKHVTYFSSTDQGLAVCVLLLVAGAFVSLVAAHFVDRGVDPISMAISDYGAREHPWFYRLAAVWLGLAGLLTAVLIGDAMFPKPTLTILCLLVFAATRWAITIFPTDIEGEEETQTGRAHLMLAIAAFASIASAAVTFAFEMRHDPFWEAQGDLLGVLAFVLPITAIVMGASRRFKPGVFGLIERVYYLCMFAWFAAIALIALGG